MEIKTVYEFAWLVTHQIVVTEDKDGRVIKDFGSGFFFHYRDRLFFVTAGHVSHPDDFDEGIRLGKEDYVWVFNNINSTTELATMLTPIGGIYSFDQFDINDELSFEIPDMKDISFAILPNTFTFTFLTQELRVDEQIIVPAGEEKLIVNSECAAELTSSDYCLVEGCVMWNNIDGIKVSRCNAIYHDLTLAGTDKDGYYILKHSEPVEYDKWVGLSGAPVFSDQGRLIGMIIEVNEHDDTIRVVPIKKITELMDYAINLEASIEKTE